MTTRSLARAAMVGTLALALAGCGLYPPATVDLPGKAGDGDGSYTITIEMPDVANLVPNQDVRVADVEVGHVSTIRVKDWHAEVTVGLTAETKLPANTTARVAQKSLLGAEYLELVPPPPGADPGSGDLREGSVIPLERAGRFPETEEVLAVLSVVLNGGGLAQIKTITTELNAALGGREQDVRALIDTLNEFVGTLDARRGDIVAAIEGINRLSVRLNDEHDTLAHAIDTIPDGLRVLNDQRKDLVRALDALSRLGDVAKDVIHSTQDDLVENLKHLQPAVNKLADSGSNLTESLSEVVSFPFPSNTSFPSVLKGDYGNLYATIDLDFSVLAQNFGLNLPFPLLNGLPPMGAGQGRANPLEQPFRPAPALPGPDLSSVPGLGGLVPGQGADRRRSSGHGDGSSSGGLLGPITGGR